MNILFKFLMFFLIASIYLEARNINPCLKQEYRRIMEREQLECRTAETCYESAIKLLDIAKRKNTGISILTKFLYSSNSEFRTGAINELGNTKSKIAMQALTKKGIHAIDTNNTNDIVSITSSLITLNGEKHAVDLAKYSKMKGKKKMLTAISGEYYIYTTGKKYRNMEKVAGKIYE